jgi:DNA-binding transcriptional LysR family regulator
MNINLDLYKVFYHVAKNKNITKAANELNITQPGISKAIKNLEEQLGCSLFIRTKSGVILTDEGKVFFDQIKQAIEIIDNAEDKLKEMIDLDFGSLNIGVSNTIVKKYLMSYIKRFHDMYPNIKITIYTNPTFHLIQRMRNGLIDFIILNMPYDVPGDMDTYKLMDVHDCFVTTDKYSELKHKVIPLRELNKYPLVLVSKGSNTRYSLDNFTNSLGFSFNPEMDLSSTSLVVDFTKMGFGIGIATKEYLDDELIDGSLFEVKTSPQLPTRYIGVMHLKNKILSRCSQEFLNMLNEKKEK